MILLKPWLFSSAMYPAQRMRHVRPRDFQAVGLAQARAGVAKINCCPYLGAAMV